MTNHVPSADRVAYAQGKHVNLSKLFEFSISGESLAVIKLEVDAEPPCAELARFTVRGRVYSVISDAEERAPAPCAAQVLTGRELQIAMLVADGLVNKEIADRLRISEWTVCTHVRRIYSKLGVSTRGAMVSRTVALRCSK
jgi:DNA-binding CsgD family transcriptional regulator